MRIQQLQIATNNVSCVDHIRFVGLAVFYLIPVIKEFCLIFMKLGIKLVNKTLYNKCQFYEKRLSD